MSRIARRHWLTGAGVLAGSSAFIPSLRDGAKDQVRARVFPAAWRPAPTGVYPVGRATRTLPIDGERVPVDLWYPAIARNHDPGATPPVDLLHPAMAPAWRDAAFAEGIGRAPVILYQPSWFSHRRENSFMLANLASHGFVALALDDIRRHPGPSSVLREVTLDQSSEAAMERSLGVVAERVALSARVAAAALDAFAADAGWSARIEAGRAGAVGFSFGGAVAAELVRAGAPMRAGVNLDGSTFGEAGRLGIGRPFLTFFGDAPFPTSAELSHPNPTIRLEAVLTQLESQRQLAQADVPGTWCFSVAGARHGDFADSLVIPPITTIGEKRVIDRPAMWNLINGHVATFFNHTLKGEDPGILNSASPWGIRPLREMQPLSLSDISAAR
ncbi:MAG: dienelactone hydrolase family protein [Pseudomonadota bacterium]